jgi:hypothetical protein
MRTSDSLPGTHLHLMLHLHVISTLHSDFLMLHLLHTTAGLFWI